MPANLENSAVATGLQKVSILILKKGNAKECSNYCTMALISHASKVMLKILQARLQKYVNCELGDVQAIFGKARGNRDQIANICWIIEKAKQLQKQICFIDYAKVFDYVDHNKLWKILQEMGIPDHLTCLLRNPYAGSVHFSSVPQSFPTLRDPLGVARPPCPSPIPEFTQTHAHWVGDAIQPSHPLSSLSPSAFNLSPNQGLFQWVSSLHQVVRVLGFQLQHQSFQWTPKTDLL